MQEIVKLETLFRSCGGSQQVTNLLQKIKKVTSEFEGKTGHPLINFQAPEKIKYPGRRKGDARPKYLPKDFGQANWRKISAGLKAMVRLRARTRDGKPAAAQKTKNNKKQNKSKKEPLNLIDATKNKIKQIKKEPLDPVDATKEIGFKRPATAQEDYQYDYHTSVGKRVKFQPSFPVSHEIVDDVKGGFNPTADGWCGFWVLAHLIYKDQEKFPLVKRYMLATLPKYSSIYASTFGTDVKQLEDIIKHGSDLCITNPNSNSNFIPACLDATRQSFFYLYKSYQSVSLRQHKLSITCGLNDSPLCFFIEIICGKYFTLRVTHISSELKSINVRITFFSFVFYETFTGFICYLNICIKGFIIFISIMKVFEKNQSQIYFFICKIN
ncbi:hypothetical protein PHYBLDRAFT_167752 [Phycomyces blakesleeanus NRRL 1555(-)]|uniref:Uncharacterized protein n=1 Tax=Phycomyces blakesleeanus (strain ATCC 8743b / DSM 1359 / FGSC 10004 / NBRC 33097 / NRRL 1555) TaxID=763407 RepID=A0A162NHL3_PHYB8|nr:hypothetical protein PHYBLDRAFT_167752 [Phycomyces blakesleeanus NRRL 1555(-)]OAD74338.1 hypothetical protein PHYBLDRAFT_167752 [Phycomyces blakesleeanus NRRL 1555(-)]|eukprot:XP_018292378.1 hypothetical protein PHYBLDRAFT_167752 [Phycomyces blakesleeanus NRRL 1555(-)]